MTLEDLSFALGVIIKVFGAYFAVFALFALIKPKPRTVHAPGTRFAVLIPARNEAEVVGQLIDSLKQQDYPGRLFDIYVVPNNCTDDTAGIARRYGAKVFECTGQVACKGDALNQAVRSLMNSEYNYDAFCVFDADNLVDRQFLSEMNNAFMSGERAAKGRNEAKNAYDSWVAGCYAIYFGMFNLFYNRGRETIGLSAKLAGTGFAVHRSVIEELGGWNTETMAEDAEFAAQLAERGIRVAWVPEALAYDEEPLSFKSSLIQRRRWCSGLVHVAGLNLPCLLRSIGRGGALALKLDSIMFQLGPFVQALAVVPPAISLALAVLSLDSSLIIALLFNTAGAYIGLAAMASVIALIAGRHDGRIIRSILTYPIFMVSWLPLQALAIVRRTNRWEQISHSRSISLSEVAQI